MKFVDKETANTWTTGGLLHEGYIKVGSKTYEEYWKHPKEEKILTLTTMQEKDNTKPLFEEYNTMYEDLTLPSDFLIDNHKTLQRRNDFEDICEALDDLQHEAMNLAFQDGFNQGELNVLQQFVEGKLDRDYILEMFGDKLGLGDKE